MKLGLQGHTFVYACGDLGVGGSGLDVNLTDGCPGLYGSIFVPEWPVK